MDKSQVRGAALARSSIKPVSEALANDLPTKLAKRGRPPKGNRSPKFDCRIQVKLTPEGRERLDNIVERVGASSFAEVVRDALRIYDIVTEEVFIHENQFLSRDKDTGEIERLIFWRQ